MPKRSDTAVAEARCVGCQSEIKDLKFFPFCSERCKMVDLGQWANESYRVAGSEATDEGEAQPVRKEYDFQEN